MAGASYDEDMDFDGEDDGEGKALVQTLLTAWVSEKAAPEVTFSYFILNNSYF